MFSSPGIRPDTGPRRTGWPIALLSRAAARSLLFVALAALSFCWNRSAAGQVRAAAPQPGAAINQEQLQKLFRTGEYAACAEGAAKAIADNPVNETYRSLQIRSEMELGRYPEALKTAEAALKAFPTSIDLRWIARDVFRFNNQPQRLKQVEDEIPQLVQQFPWRYGDAANRVIVGKFLLSQGLDAKKVLDGTYSVVKKQQPNFVRTWLATGDLALEKSDFAMAGESFTQAVKLDPGDPDAHYGLARAFAPSEPPKAEAAIKTALERNPNHIPSLLFIIEDQIDSERYEDAEGLLMQVAKVNLHHPRALALRAVLAHLRNQPDKEKQHREAALKYWADNPEVDYLIGKKLSQKYRFTEGAAYQRTALGMNAKYLPAAVQLAQDLLRLGDETEGWRLADEVYKADGYNIFAHNLLTLQDSLSKFRSLEEDNLIVRMDAREADIYGQRVLGLLKRAKRELCAKYDVTLDKPIIVEMFPRQEDFAIRTFGLPGGAGFLGVCFGSVITANSPASQTQSPSCWESTLWHEFCHVVTLNKTLNKMPRWLSEGISVFEERQADPSWGQRITPRYRKMLLGDELTPVSRLSGAFLNPPSPLHLQFAYFESSLVIEYLVDTYGRGPLQQVLVDLGRGITINDALVRVAGTPEALDSGFAQYARKYANEMAPMADWSEPEIPRRTDSAMIAAWVKDHPNNYPALLRLAQQLISEKKWEAAKAPLETMRQLYPKDAGGDSLYFLLASVHRQLKEPKAERAVLEELAKLSDDNLALYERLAELTSEAGDWELTKAYALRWLAINPLQPAPHRRAAEAAEKLHDDALASESYRALLLLNPADPADLHLKLAGALQRAGDLKGARKHALLALEETPRFRPAHRLLLEIVAAKAAQEEVDAKQPAKEGEGKPKPSF